MEFTETCLSGIVLISSSFIGRKVLEIAPKEIEDSKKAAVESEAEVDGGVLVYNKRLYNSLIYIEFIHCPVYSLNCAI